MVCFYVIYRYVFSEWRSIRPVEINQYDITIATHYDITMDNDIARDAHCEITIGHDVARDTHCDVTMGNDITMCAYIMASQYMTLIWTFYYVFFGLCLIVLFYYGQYGLKTRTSLCLISMGWRTQSLFLCKAISLILQTCEISLHKYNSCVLTRLIKHSLVLVI